MLTDSERFAFNTRRHHVFSSTGNAYDAVQCDEAISTGDTLVVLAEEVVGVAMTWPFAVTQAHGNLHALSAPREGETLEDLARSLHVCASDFEHAAEIARRLGFPLDPQIEALLARPPG
jgi:N-acetylglutamate synthase/N-acetylornithine aminotransferase